jgi:Domain of unknown function (DUF5606)
MEYNKIIAVSGLPGLYELLSSKSDGAIVRSLDDKSTKFVSSRIHNFSHLESIEIYTVRDNVNLVDILKAMENSKEKLPDDKDSSGLKNYFTKVYPELDFERVYSSDLKKMVKWFVVLKSNNVEIALPEPAPEEEVADEQPEKTEAAAGKPAKKKPVTAEKVAAPITEKPKKAEAAEKPKAKAKTEEEPKPKKAAAKKKAPAAKKAAAPVEKPKKAAKKKG